MDTDIRKKPTLSHDDITGLNFIRQPTRFFYRNHYTEGLRSRLIQVLEQSDITAENQGIVQDGVRMYPKARPVAMLRIFRNKFSSHRDLLREINNYKIIQRRLPTSHYAVSSEFVVDYIRGGEKEMLLCGLQEYVPGDHIDPWHAEPLSRFEKVLESAPEGIRVKAYKNLASFVRCLKEIALQTGTIPDLAGVGNLIVTPRGSVKLVDINNISKLSTDRRIPVDDKGYPASDKSVQTLDRIERHILGRTADADDALYGFFLDPRRMKRVAEIETLFHQKTMAGGNDPGVGS